jgi:hypothetical protein
MSTTTGLLQLVPALNCDRLLGLKLAGLTLVPLVKSLCLHNSSELPLPQPLHHQRGTFPWWTPLAPDGMLRWSGVVWSSAGAATAPVVRDCGRGGQHPHRREPQPAHHQPARCPGGARGAAGGPGGCWVPGVRVGLGLGFG